MQRFFLDNLGLKAFSLLIALILYLFIAYEADTPIELEVPIKVISDPDIAVTSDHPSSVGVTYRGPWASLRVLEREINASYTIDLRDHPPGPVTVTLQPTQMPGVPGMDPVKVQPSMLTIRLDRIIERQVPVRAEVRGAPDHGYTVGEILIAPKRIAVKGPALDVEEISYVLTKPVDVTGVNSAVTAEIDVRRPAYPVELVNDDAVVNVTVVIEEEYMERYLKDVPVRLEGKVRGLHLKTRTVSFSIRGPLLALESIDQEEVEAVVMSPELDNLTRGVLELVPEIRGLPQRVYIIGRRPTVAVEYHPRRGRGRRKPG